MNSLAFSRPLATRANVGAATGDRPDVTLLGEDAQHLADRPTGDGKFLIELVDARDGRPLPVNTRLDPLTQRLVQLEPHQPILIELDHVRDARPSWQSLPWRDLPLQAMASISMLWQAVARIIRNFLASEATLMTLPTDPADTLDELRTRYPNWDIHTSGVGRIWAMTRERTLMISERVRACVDADTAHDLDDLLAEQERLRGRTAHDLDQLLAEQERLRGRTSEADRADLQRIPPQGGPA
jgi:hypothetical protein